MKKLTYLFLTLIIVACTTDDSNNVDDTQAEWLYVHTAIEANATNSTTLVMPVTNDIFAFTDRPNREHKYISAYEFVSYWSEDATNSFQFDPPNAVLTSVSDDGVAEVEVVIIGASTDGDNITYTIQSPKLTENATFQNVSLFVDGNGEDSQPTPCNGVWLDGNGVTVRACNNAVAGDTGVIGGVTYTIVDEATLAYKIYWQEDVTQVCTSLITDMNELFYFETESNPINQDIGSWDVSNVTDMYSMFFNCYEFNQDISNWNVSNVTNMSDMFAGAKAFNQPIGDWDVSSVTDMSSMFGYNYQLIDGYLSVFNQPIGNWDVSSVTDMSGMFLQATTFNQPIDNWDVSNVTNMYGMFADAIVFNQDLSSWSVDNVTNCDYFDVDTPQWTLPQPNFTNCTP